MAVGLTYLLSPASHQQPTILKLSNLLFVFFSIQIKEWSCRDQTTTSIPNWPSPNRTEFNFQINCPIWMNKGKRVNHFQAFIRSSIFILFASLSLFLFSKQSDDPSVVIRSLWDAKQRHMVFLGQINATNSESFYHWNWNIFRDSCWYAPVALKQSLKFIPVRLKFKYSW